MLRGIHSQELKQRDWSALVDNLLLAYGNWDGFCVLHAGKNALKGQASEYIPLEPVLKIYADQHGSYVRTSSGLLQRFTGVWEALNWLNLKLTNAEYDTALPIVAGYLSYELLHHIEDLPLPTYDPFKSPLYLFYLYSSVLEKPGLEKHCDTNIITLHSFDLVESWEPYWEANLEEQFPRTKDLPDSFDLAQVIQNTPELYDELSGASSLTRRTYVNAVEQIRNLISHGSVYQVNLTQRFSFPCSSSSVHYFRILDRLAPARYGGFLNAQAINGFASFSIASSSPELFLYSDGEHLLTSPIKGSRARNNLLQDDATETYELKSSVKDCAELAMIVDLARNDLGKVCEFGSIRVLNHARIDSLQYVHHLVSDIVGKRRQSQDLVAVIKAMFPCGSITGAPKVSAMQIISRLESATRGVYTGAFGFIGTANRCQFNVAIRSAVIQSDKIYFQTGGGIVFDSNPELEYEESIVKARGLYLAWKLGTNTISRSAEPILV